jgi:hypothetical protein
MKFGDNLLLCEGLRHTTQYTRRKKDQYTIDRPDLDYGLYLIYKDLPGEDAEYSGWVLSAYNLLIK